MTAEMEGVSSGRTVPAMGRHACRIFMCNPLQRECIHISPDQVTRLMTERRRAKRSEN